MSIVEKYPQGAPCWIDLITTDVDGARAFYGELFGWNYDAYPMPGDATYYMSTIGGKNVAGLMQQPTPDAGPTSWQTYIAVDDAEAAAARVTEAGGTLLFPVDEIPGSGRMTIALDTEGARFGVWQTTGHIGSAVVNEHGAPLWHELQSGDPAAAAAFYSAVLGVEAKTSEVGDISYTELYADGTSSAGVMPKQSGDEPNVWLVYFGANDPDETARLAESIGATVLAPAFDIDGVGRMAILADPQGGVFAVMRGES
ncbi:VOC family protein [Subtercola boreus]|uniref:VOC domain-containing protein n=1 Tax=Subtercola boreus TaxID=120213 RepID=A0A3E0WEA6_9MICO|nr:VOC family protein [Subtercola boreus]RFA23552.1 hypothetical protein B7R24_01340 [Subtercola boreus]RFA23946.1 hypothetical protein B7R23_01340 [Subtercola boreus]RFA29644.1 hypothetical protein B7R25_01335 [Subtercola boreus]